MSDVVIKVENLSKKYILSHQSQERYTALRDVMANGVKNLGKKLMSPFTPHVSRFTESEDFYALKDVSFEIKQGDRVGIIGRNGAGKSTLLKILSRITEPTSGRIEITGRVASLLEVGTGFHPELTGRENIFLNGAILGMGRVEIKRKFDEIVDFAEVEKFLDTPVKRYSSGMYVRLAFAVAAHLEPEILIVDVVLEVGDAQFQKKCLGKMEEVGKQGRTVLFVSHNMSAIRSLCNKGILLERGCIRFDGDAEKAISTYSLDTLTGVGEIWRRPENAETPGMHFESIQVSLCGEQPQLRLHCDITLQCHEQTAGCFIAVDICDSSLLPLMQALPEHIPFIKGVVGTHRLQLDVALPPLVPGVYSTDFWIGSHFTNTQDYMKKVATFEVVQSPNKDRSFPHDPHHGFLVPTTIYNYTPPGPAGV
jgi:lipopolysaccharide transport system ATP-binding protein